MSLIMCVSATSGPVSVSFCHSVKEILHLVEHNIIVLCDAQIDTAL